MWKYTKRNADLPNDNRDQLVSTPKICVLQRPATATPAEKKSNLVLWIDQWSLLDIESDKTSTNPGASSQGTTWN